MTIAAGIQNVPQETQSTGLPMIAQLITLTTGISLERMRGKQRTAPVTEARALFSQMAHDCDYSYAEIGRFLGMDHTSIMHHLRGRE